MRYEYLRHVRITVDYARVHLRTKGKFNGGQQTMALCPNSHVTPRDYCPESQYHINDREILARIYANNFTAIEVSLDQISQRFAL